MAPRHNIKSLTPGITWREDKGSGSRPDFSAHQLQRPKLSHRDKSRHPVDVSPDISACVATPHTQNSCTSDKIHRYGEHDSCCTPPGRVRHTKCLFHSRRS